MISTKLLITFLIIIIGAWGVWWAFRRRKKAAAASQNAPKDLATPGKTPQNLTY